ncbi:MAG: hypothetical protein PUP46_05930 [Endozoicomonas sp. (ex Botrylloides leachii)]|nr:hypothetical protein [Endozoicomonas sp. (ex Botrylloides leachii)]
MSSERIFSPIAATTFDLDIDPDKNLTDFASEAYLLRGLYLDAEVRSLVGQIEQSNAYLTEINKLITEANRIIYQGDNFSATTWASSESTEASEPIQKITLDNGYGLSFYEGGTFQITDKNNNNLVFADGTLIPTDKDNNSFAGIPLQGNATVILDDGTKITLQVSSVNVVTDVFISRGNQGMSINSVNVNPTVTGPDLNGVDINNGVEDGDILVENGGVHSLLNAGNDIINFDISSGVLTDEQKHFINNQLDIDIDLSAPLTAEIWENLKPELILARDNLTGSNQLQTVQLQSALTRYNQNYDAMSNSHNKIYTLLKDILANFK